MDKDVEKCAHLHDFLVYYEQWDIHYKRNETSERKTGKMSRNTNNNDTTGTPTTGLANVGPFVSAVQDSYMLRLDSEILGILIKRFDSAVMRGDPVALQAIIQSMATHVYHAGVQLKAIAPENVTSWPSEDKDVRRLLESQTSEHSWTQ